jgi:hypothetical protein
MIYPIFFFCCLKQMFNDCVRNFIKKDSDNFFSVFILFYGKSGNKFLESIFVILTAYAGMKGSVDYIVPTSSHNMFFVSFNL